MGHCCCGALYVSTLKSLYTCLQDDGPAEQLGAHDSCEIDAMYWPIGTPEAFEQGIPEDSFADELQAAKHEHASAHGEPLDSSTVDVEQGGQHAPVTVVLPDEGSTQGNGNILAIRVARAGHILVTITDRTLTIWQVKVRQATSWL